LNTETGEISPDRGNHAIKVTGAGRMHPGIPRRVRCFARHLAPAWPGGKCGRLPIAVDRVAAAADGELG
jgi:hypothetical protein